MIPYFCPEVVHGAHCRSLEFTYYQDVRVAELSVLQVVPSYEHGELILKNYKENLSEATTPIVVTPSGDPNTSEVVLSSKDVVYSEV